MLSAAEVGELLGVSQRLVYELARAGKLPAYRIGRAVRFEPRDIEAYKATLPKPKPPLTARELRVYERLRRAAPEAEMPALTPDQLAIATSRVRNLRRAPWADRFAIEAIYIEAQRLTEETGIPHHVDHEIPLQGAYVSGLHVETNLKVMPRIDNLRKRNRFEP